MVGPRPAGTGRGRPRERVDLPVAPAVMVGDEIVVEGSDISEEDLEAAICNHLGLPPPEPKKKGVLGRLLNR